MNRLMDVFGKLAFVLLATWVVMAGLGMTDMPGSQRQQLQSKGRRQRAKGDIWGVPVVAAPSAEDNLAWPAARVM